MHGTVDAAALRLLLAQPPLRYERPRVYGSDGGVWVPYETEAIPERGYHHHPSHRTVGVRQIKSLVYGEPRRGFAPLFVCDVNCDPVQLGQVLEDTQVSILLRLGSDGCFYSRPCANNTVRDG